LLEGSVTPKFGLLSNLVFLVLGSNQLEGRIPDELGQLMNLTLLDLGNNRLSGEIPQAVFVYLLYIAYIYGIICW
jgi:Leucine-rich repeat (LRR) protein